MKFDRAGKATSVEQKVSTQKTDYLPAWLVGLETCLLSSAALLPIITRESIDLSPFEIREKY